MVDMNALLALQGQLFLLMALGAFFSRRGILDGGFQKGLTDLVIDLVLPCSIITSFEAQVEEEGDIVLNARLLSLHRNCCTRASRWRYRPW